MNLRNIVSLVALQ